MTKPQGAVVVSYVCFMNIMVPTQELLSEQKDLQALNPNGSYPRKPRITSPSCTKPRQATMSGRLFSLSSQITRTQLFFFSSDLRAQLFFISNSRIIFFHLRLDVRKIMLRMLAKLDNYRMIIGPQFKKNFR